MKFPKIALGPFILKPCIFTHLLKIVKPEITNNLLNLVRNWKQRKVFSWNAENRGVERMWVSEPRGHHSPRRLRRLIDACRSDRRRRRCHRRIATLGPKINPDEPGRPWWHPSAADIVYECGAHEEAPQLNRASLEPFEVPQTSLTWRIFELLIHLEPNDGRKLAVRTVSKGREEAVKRNVCCLAHLVQFSVFLAIYIRLRDLHFMTAGQAYHSALYSNNPGSYTRRQDLRRFHQYS